jgi:predicted ArsR family transcriptional regulator
MDNLITEEETQTTRQRVLKTLLNREKCTINELANAVDINPISVRHHITKLEADGLVKSQEEKHGVGRPRRLYYLSEKGHEQFPTRYLRLTLRLLAQLKDTLPKTMVNELFTQVARDIASDYDLAINGLSMEERLNMVKKLLGEEGFSVEWELNGDEYLIREINCPYYHIGQNYPEVCAVDQTLISSLLSVPAEKIKCILNGDTQCTYVVSKYTPKEKIE